MFRFSVKSKILATTLLASPLVLLSPANYAHAACTVTSGGGTISVPANGSTVTCPSGEATTTRIGDGSTDATVILEAGHALTVFTTPIYLNTVTATLGNGASINSNGYGIQGLNGAVVTLGDNVQITASLPVLAYGGGGGNRNVTLTTGESVILTSNTFGGVYADKDATVTLGKNSIINAQTYGIFAVAGDAVITLGEGVQINATSSQGIYAALGSATVTLGKDSQISSRTTAIQGRNGINATFEQNASISATAGINGRGIYSAFGDINITLNDGSQIRSSRSAVSGLNLNKVDIVAGTSTTILSTGNTAIVASNNADTVDISGLAQGGAGASIDLSGGNDVLTLRNGSQLVGSVDGGANTDTLNLYGTNSEDDNFNNFESLQVNGTDWALSGTSTFGTVDINSGIFRNNGTITADVNINSGTIFGGTGNTIGNIINSGITAPGNSIGTQTITGNFVQNANGNLIIEFDSTSADLLDITGSAALDGSVTFSEFAGGTADGTTYTFLQAAGGITGSFATVNNPLFFNTLVNIGANNATVTLNRIQTITTAQTTSESVLASALDSVLSSNPSSISEIDSIMNGFESDAAASDFLASQSSIVTGTSLNAVSSAVGQISNVISSRFISPSMQNKASSHVADISPAAGGDNDDDQHSETIPIPKRKTSWIEAVGGLGKTDGNATSRGTNYKQYGLTAGLEFALSLKLNVGFFGSYSKSLGKVKRLDDKTNTNIYQAGIYGSKKIDTNLRIGGSISSALIDFNTSRNTVNGNAQASFYGVGGFAQSSLAYDIPTKNGWLSPTIGFEGATIYHQGYNEKGAGVLDLSISDQRTSQLASVIGLESRVIDTGLFKELSPYTISSLTSIAWGHEFLDNSTNTSVKFASAPSVSFESESVKKARDYIKLKLDLSGEDLGSNGSIGYVRYDGKISSDEDSHSLTMGLRIKW